MIDSGVDGQKIKNMKFLSEAGFFFSVLSFYRTVYKKEEMVLRRQLIDNEA